MSKLCYTFLSSCSCSNLFGRDKAGHGDGLRRGQECICLAPVDFEACYHIAIGIVLPVGVLLQHVHAYQLAQQPLHLILAAMHTLAQSTCILSSSCCTLKRASTLL